MILIIVSITVIIKMLDVTIITIIITVNYITLDSGKFLMIDLCGDFENW